MSPFKGRRSFVHGKEVIPVCLFHIYPIPWVCDHATNPSLSLRSNPSRCDHHLILHIQLRRTPCREGLAPAAVLVMVL